MVAARYGRASLFLCSSVLSVDAFLEWSARSGTALAPLGTTTVHTFLDRAPLFSPSRCRRCAAWPFAQRLRGLAPTAKRRGRCAANFAGRFTSTQASAAPRGTGVLPVGAVPDHNLERRNDSSPRTACPSAARVVWQVRSIARRLPSSGTPRITLRRVVVTWW